MEVNISKTLKDQTIKRAEEVNPAHIVPIIITVVVTHAIDIILLDSLTGVMKISSRKANTKFI
jgi:hypothetical protein